MILMIDNYDSFVYNLVQYLMMLKEEVKVIRNDELTIDKIRKLDPEMIVLSPGPCTPMESGISLDIIRELKGEYPILGICLGHQAIGQEFGANIIKAIEPVHGRVFEITHDGKGVFKGLNNPLKVTRYHSLVIDSENVPESLEVTARLSDGQIMGIRHKEYLIEGVQFHPEAILTEQGLELLNNFLIEAREFNKVKKLGGAK
ncbi:anthranilate synthase component II [Helicovermis profundi]|uniref:Aminodeoxychorismate/anthranilate synthase component II n=1 Tax=Helicovermis profundi TaxID=3065157 RepID=A0AAU9E8J5_9FIRM|nr:aminodeoxychorismate/anthranilate synthase component II [Clostridia bacterium S502]